jgi:hypothetical protein
MDITKVTTQGVRSAQGKSIEKTKIGAKFSLGENDDQSPQQVNSQSQMQFSPLDALFLNLDQNRKKQKQFIEHGNNLLEQLDSLRMGIIAGHMPRSVLQSISDTLTKRNGLPTEEPLRNILLEIETRAKVELAKLDKAI